MKNVPLTNCRRFTKLIATAILVSIVVSGTSFSPSATASVRLMENSSGLAAPTSVTPSAATPVAAPRVRKARKAVLKPGYSPAWAQAQFGANVSYFSDRTVRPVETINDAIFDESTSKALRAEYESRLATEEYRDHAGLTENFEYKSRFEAMKSFAKRAVNSLYKVRLKNEGKKMKRIAEDAPVVLREPVAAVVLAAALYTGKTMNFKVAEGLRVASHASVKHKDAAVSMNLYDTGLSTGVAYNRDTNLTAQVAQQISTEISAVISSAEKGSASMVYSLSF